MTTKPLFTNSAFSDFQFPPICPTGSTGIILNACHLFDPINENHYPTGPGVYVYGLKTHIGGKLCFVPVYVGQSSDLRYRLFFEHYGEKFAYQLGAILAPGLLPASGDRNQRKEMWHFPRCMSMADLKARYVQMALFDGMSRKTNKLANILNPKNNLEHLIYFQDFRFYENICFGTTLGGTAKNMALSSAYLKIQRQLAASTGKKVSKKKPDPNEMLHRLRETLQHFHSNFFFIYARQTPKTKPPHRTSEQFRNDLANERELVEKYVKVYLADKGISTTAIVGKGGSIPSDDKGNFVKELLKDVENFFPKMKGTKLVVSPQNS